MAYTPTIWQSGDTITAEKLNKIEGGIEAASEGGGGGVFVVPLTETEVPGPYGIGTETRLVNDTITYQDIYEAWKADKLVVAKILAVTEPASPWDPTVTIGSEYILTDIQASEVYYGNTFNVAFSRYDNTYGVMETIFASGASGGNTIALSLPASTPVGYTPKYISLTASGGSLLSDGLITDFVSAGERVGPQALPYVCEVTASGGGALATYSTFYQILAINNYSFASYEVIIQNPITGTKYTSGYVTGGSTTPLTFTEVQS